MKISELRSKAMKLEPVLRIGKSGLTLNMIKEIKKELRKSRLIKLKLLKSALEDIDRKTFAKEIAKKTDSQLVHNVGFTVVLYKA